MSVAIAKAVTESCKSLVDELNLNLTVAIVIAYTVFA